MAKAAESEEEAKALFTTFGNKDGKLSTGDVKTVVRAHGKSIEAIWTDELIDDTLALFGDNDEMLDLGAFSNALAELKAKGGKFDAADIKARAAARTKVLPVWTKHVKEGPVWDKGCTGKLIRELNSEAYWDDFGLKVTTWHAELTGSEDKKAQATLEQFVALYPSLLAEIETIKASWASESVARTEAASAAKAAQYAPDKAEWEVNMKQANEAITKAFLLGKTPLLVDCTTLPGDDKNASFSPLENFYSYSGDVLIEMKKAVVDVNIKKEKSLDELQREFAKKLLMCLKQGRQLVLLCSNSNPPITSKFAHADLFPMTADGLLDAAKLKSLLGHEAPKLEESFVKGLLAYMNESGLKDDPSYSVAFGHDDFRVVLVTKFAPEDYKGFLEAELPFEKLQPIKVTVET